LALGLGLTIRTLDAGLGFGALRRGPWVAWPKNGTAEIDPYSRARFARSGEVPLGSAEGLSFLARTDDAGQPLHGNCDYVLQGSSPPARFWTLTLLAPNGSLIENDAGRYGFTSAEILRSADGNFAIAIAPDAGSGNWLPTGRAETYVLLMRLYDTPLVAATSLHTGAMPRLMRGACR
jgi:hypothetical protein